MAYFGPSYAVFKVRKLGTVRSAIPEGAARFSTI